MKNFVMLLASLMLTICIYAQENAISKYFSSYQASPDVTKVSVTSKMFSLFTELDFEDEDQKAILEAIGKLKGIKAIIDQKTDNGNKQYFAAADIFNAGFLSSMLAGHSPAIAAEMGQRLSAECLQHRGALLPADSWQHLRG